MGKVSYDKELRELQKTGGGTLVTIDMDGRWRCTVQCLADDQLVKELTQSIQSHIERQAKCKSAS